MHHGEFEALEDAEETQFCPERVDAGATSKARWGSWPYYGLGMGGMGVGDWAWAEGSAWPED